MFSQGSTFVENSKFSFSENIVQRRNPDGSIVVMSISDEDLFYKITGVAADIFTRLDGTTSIGEILQEVHKDYEVTLEKLYEDTENFLNALIKLNIIVLK